MAKPIKNAKKIDSKKLFSLYAHLGFMNPFYIENNNHLIIDTDFEEIVKHQDQRNAIDPVAVIEILNKSYTFGDRTFIKDVNLTPWMAKPNKEQTSWEYVEDFPPHGNIVVAEEVAAESLFKKLLQEIKNYIGKSLNVGILLSGGMDSRIIAAAIKHLQDNNEINVNIIALTWGIENSRDVIYAKRIADLFGWTWEYFELSHKNLIENIEIAAKHGALYSPVHLHAMPKISELKNIDCIIAGSFGDSIGRAEYSGIKVKNLKQTTSRMINKFKIIKNNIYKTNIPKVHGDIDRYHKLFPRQENYQYYELEKQIHYMRKQLNQCMSVINEKIPLFQAFTSPEVFGYMWSLSPEVRNDKIYYHILNKYFPGLLELPWARTGCRYLSENCDKPDNYLKNYHNYGKWIREDIDTIIQKKVLSSHIKKLNVFNMSALEKLLWVNSFSGDKLTMIDEYLIWIASLSDAVQLYNIQGLNNVDNSIIDKFNGNITSILQFIVFKLKHKLKV